ncbi:unnamed protein product [Effrenium voratum]|uniref:Uncharacterized protein n=1 Tax=Effrenium voratum TaxID=2562239 RepID=A0AA36JJQ7_9DINO|nr:unnamed protein product [Effrenium voratum]
MRGPKPWPKRRGNAQTGDAEAEVVAATAETEFQDSETRGEAKEGPEDTEVGDVTGGLDTEGSHRTRKTSSYLARRRFVPEEPPNFRRSGYAQQPVRATVSYASQRGRPAAAATEEADVADAGSPSPGPSLTLCTERRRIRSVFKAQPEVGQDLQSPSVDDVTVNGTLAELH